MKTAYSYEYTLTATRGQDFAVETLYEANDHEAILAAIALILKNAHAGEAAELWAKGKITLQDSEGVLIKEMEEKN